jgi:2-polyprenyl-3-methyl-5-hydroxy-6-metoxy-1,4-benzoquinol methylase
MGDGCMNEDDGFTSPPTKPIQRDWEETFRRGDWDFLAGMGEVPRNALVAGYIHRLAHRGRILDVGCGEGVLLDYLDLGRIDYCGFDVSSTAIERARRRGAKAKLFVASMDDFEPSKGERYDMVVFNEALSHSPRPIETLRRFSAYTKISGHVLISQFQTFKPRSDGAFFSALFKAEIEAGRISPIYTAEVKNCDNGLRWTLYCLQGNAETEG